MSRQSWSRQKALPHTTGLGVRRLERTTECGALLCRNKPDLGARRQRSKLTHDKAWARGNNALGARTTRSERIHDKDVRTTEEFYQDRLG